MAQPPLSFMLHSLKCRQSKGRQFPKADGSGESLPLLWKSIVKDFSLLIPVGAAGQQTGLAPLSHTHTGSF